MCSSLATADGKVDIADKFSPTYDLTDKTFEAVERDLSVERQGFVYNFLWTEQADVDEGR